MIEAILAAVVAVFAAFFGGVYRGRKAQKDKDESRRLAETIEQERRRRELLQLREKVQRETDAISSGSAADRLRDKWSRD